MKKTVGIILASILVLSLTGCGAKSKPADQTASTQISTKAVSYKDGVYDIVHKSIKPGFEEAIITIKGGKMQQVELKRLDDSKKEVDYSIYDGSQEEPNLKQYRFNLAKTMMDKQTVNVDTISSATESSKGWIAAANDALAKASK